MLVGEHGGGHEHRHLLGVARRLEGRAYGHLGLAEPHVAAHEAVHGLGLLHVGLHVLCGLELVGGVLVEEARLQLMLHEGVAAEGKALLVPPLGIEADEVAGDVLDLLLGLLLQTFPCSRAEGAQAWGLASGAAAVLAYLVERVYAHVHDVAVLVYDAYDLLVGVAGRDAHQTSELTYAEVYVYDEVAWLHLLQLLHGECHLAGPCGVAAQAVLVETVEYLVVGEEADAQRVVGESVVKRVVYGGEGEILALGFHLIGVEDVAQTACLLLTVGEDVELVAHQHVVGQ